MAAVRRAGGIVPQREIVLIDITESPSLLGVRDTRSSTRRRSRGSAVSRRRCSTATAAWWVRSACLRPLCASRSKRRVPWPPTSRRPRNGYRGGWATGWERRERSLGRSHGPGRRAGAGTAGAGWGRRRPSRPTRPTRPATLPFANPRSVGRSRHGRQGMGRGAQCPQRPAACVARHDPGQRRAGRPAPLPASATPACVWHGR